MQGKTSGQLRNLARTVQEQWSPKRGVAFGIGILLLGAAFAGGYATNAPALAEARADIAWQTELADRYRQSRVEADAEWKASYESLQEDMTELRTSTAARSADLQAREEAVIEAEKLAASRSFAGGQVLVGDQVEPGTYRTGPLSDSCYYAWMSGTTADADIIDNNIVQEGTATVTLSAGEHFESSRCGTWTKID